MKSKETLIQISQAIDMPSILIKFGKKEDMKDLIYNGTVYCNTIEYFRKCEQKERGDSFEGTLEIRNYDEEDEHQFMAVLPKSGKQLSARKFKFRKYLTDIKGNLYCMYSLNAKIVSQQQRFKIDPKMKEFGNYMVIITKPIEFLSAIVKQLKAKQLAYNMQHVRYYNYQYFSGELDLFSKPDYFRYQHEYRIALFRNSSEAVSVSIGNIESYANLFPVSAIDNAEIGIQEIGI